MDKVNDTDSNDLAEAILSGQHITSSMVRTGGNYGEPISGIMGSDSGIVYDGEKSNIINNDE